MAETVQRAACLLAVLALVACDRSASAGDSVQRDSPTERPTQTSAERAEEEDVLDDVPEFEPEIWDGVCLAHSWEDDGVKGYGTDASAEAFEHLSELGVGWISLTPFGFMESLKATRLKGEHDGADLPAGAERADRVVAAARQARSHGMKSVLKPHIWVRGGEWRGRIDPRNDAGELDWSAWWTSYESFIVYWAKVAARAEIESFVVGVELYSALQADSDRFIDVIAAVREVYDGEVHYAANWNEPVGDEVWRALDAVGVQFYPPLAESFDASTDDVRREMRRYLDEWSEVAVRNDRPLILTEVGYRSAISAATHPNAWPERTDGIRARPDEALQKKLYALLFSELERTPRFKGVFVWKYFTNRDTDEEGEAGFSPRGRPAEKVLDVAYGPP